MSSEPILNCSDVTKQFGGLVAVEDVDLTLDREGVYGLIGPNGAGKTTLFNMIAGLLSPTRGTIVFNGEDVTGDSQHKICQAGLARTFQNPRPFSSQTVLENVIVGQRFGSGSLDREAARQHLEFVNLEEKANMGSSDLTMVEQKRLDLARALATEPDLLLLDEIMAGLNPSEIEDFLALIESISTDCTVFVIEHIMGAVMEVSDRIFVLQNGSKIAEGSPEEISSNSRVIEAYLGEEFAEYA